MPTLSQLIPKVFARAWQRYGQPVMEAVRPVASWNLPAPFAYDNETDTIQYLGTVLPNPESYWASDLVYIVPASRSADLDVLIAAGVVPAGTVDVFILDDDVAKVQVAHAVQIDGDWYDVQEVAHAPLGTGATGMWARVRLARRS